MYCYNNNLSSLPELPNSLKRLNCSDNNISIIPEFPKSLTFCWCDNNSLSSLPVLSNSLILLNCYCNNLSILPQIPNSLKNILYFDNPIHTYIKKYFDDNLKKYQDYEKQMKKKFANKIGNWFLDCKYNPKYLYCRKRLMKEYDELYN